MVGIFNMFGVSFLFWALMGCLRFVFETLHTLREARHGFTTLNLIIASVAGTMISISLFLLFFFGLGPVDVMMTETAFPSFALSTLIVWLGCVSVGSYLATRIYIDRPYFVSGIVGIGTVAVGATVLVLAQVDFAFSKETLQWEAVWIAVTMIAAFSGGHIARALNALERERTKIWHETLPSARIKPEEVAVVIAAYNEEASIAETLEALEKVTTKNNVYVGSDGSSDNTVKIARKAGVHVDDIQPNGGKARALTYIIENNNLLTRYKAVFFLDAEIKPAADVLQKSLPLFDDPDVVVVVNRSRPIWPKHYYPRWHLIFTAYRIRLWRVLQFCIRYGQTWKYTNASPIIPGGSSLYRTSALKHIRIHVPGMIIEDFNMTFNVHHQKLGKIAFNPGAYVWDQEPYSLRDYIKQVRRWYLGFFQTVRHHGIWPSWFFLSMALFTTELLIGCFMFLLLPFFVLEIVLSGQNSLVMSYGILGSKVTLFGIVVSVFVFDYIVTIIVAMIEKKPLLLVYWFAFFPLRYIEACVFMYTLFVGLFIKPKTDGRWISPARRGAKASTV